MLAYGKLSNGSYGSEMMQPNQERAFDVPNNRAEAQAKRRDVQLSHALKLPPAIQRELIEQLRKADRPVLATPVVP
jgi:hypothetical protein